MTPMQINPADHPAASHRRRAGALAFAVAGLTAVLGLAGPPSAHAHHASEAYLNLSLVGAPDGVQVEQRLELALRDLDRELVLDADGDGALRWGEVRRRFGDIVAFAHSGMTLRFDGARCRPGLTGQPSAAPAPLQDPGDQAYLEKRRDGHYAVLRTRWSCDRPPDAVRVEYRLFADSDSGHRALLRLLPGPSGWGGRADAPAEAVQAIKPGAPAVRLAWPKPGPADSTNGSRAAI